MRVIAIIDQPEVIEKILRCLGLWCGGTAGRPPPVTISDLYTREAFADTDPMPDYENVLTD